MIATLDLINASAGTGEAVRSNVTILRIGGSTTITVDSLANWPNKFIATAGKLVGTTLTTPFVFAGHKSGSTIIIDQIAPGYTDAGNAVGDIIVLKPTSLWGDTIASYLAVSLSNTGTLATNALAQIYPIGSLYMSTLATNPATTFGFGTWLAFAAGRTLIGVGTSDQAFAAAATGGESNHVLSGGEMPAHAHGVSDPGHSHDAGNLIHAGGGGADWDVNTSAANRATSLNWGDGTRTSASGTGITTQNAGSSLAHNNLQPYIVTYIWQRTA